MLGAIFLLAHGFKTTSHAHEPVFSLGPETIYEAGIGIESELEFEGGHNDQSFSLGYEILYGFTENLSLTVKIPHVFDHPNTGLGDIQFRGKYQIFRRDAPGLQDKISAILGVKFPTGSEDSEPPRRTGTTGFLSGLSYGHESRTLYYFATLRYVLQPENDDFKPGDELFYDAAIGYRFEITFRERINIKDWEKVKELERFHYRGKGLNRLVGRRTVLLAEIEGYGIVGFGVLSATVPTAKPRFELLKTNFTNQMETKLINQIARIPRIVIHPEFRGMNLGVLMGKHLVQYAKEYWDINHYTPIMVEVIAAMIEYHKFFEKAGFIKLGYTTGYTQKPVIPQYGNGSFESRVNIKSYEFMRNQKPKPYLVFPLDPNLKEKIVQSYERSPGI
ncbi:MAG: GNAT family N-acetyltransferase, partial [Candidatus Glassbacteria bacterium]